VKALSDTIGRAAEISGLRIDEEAPLRRVFRCERCGREIDRAGWACDDCLHAHVATLRAQKLAAARASVPEKHRSARFGTPELARYVNAPQAVLERARALLDRPVILIHGAAGTGKTTLACALLQHVIEAGADTRCSGDVFDRARDARFVEAYELSMARAAHRLGQDDPPAVAAAMRASVLVLDELGREDTRNRDVESVIHRRHRENRTTIITTWLSIDDIRTRYDEGIYRRLCEGSVVIELTAGAR
jgi:DNA replication protein DnaC